jgi:1-acyl-sn-glycerol-3-phosphate acyltransferase
VTSAHPWMPVSPCDASCLPAAGSEPSVGPVLAGLRMAAAVLLMLLGTGLAAVFPLLGRRGRWVVLRLWLRLALAAFGVTLRVIGPPPARGALLVANHVSWLDIMVLSLITPCRMVAKAEVRGWFLVGRLATAAGTIYLDRERLRTLPAAVSSMASALRAGETVAVFPEGTTWCGRRSGRYRSAAFQAAIDADAPVVPVALRFLRADGTSTSATAYVDMELWSALWRTARLRGLVVEAEVLPELAPGDYLDRRGLAEAAEKAVASL